MFVLDALANTSDASFYLATSMLGADRGIRTHDPLFTKQPLWPLSYVGIHF